MHSVTGDDMKMYEYFIQWEYDNMLYCKERHSSIVASKMIFIIIVVFSWAENKIRAP